MVAEITRVSSQTILHYQKHSLIQPSGFDHETLHTRRIDYLRSTCEANLSGLKLILDLLGAGGTPANETLRKVLERNHTLEEREESKPL